MPDPSPEALARTYYRALDDGDYAALADVLAPAFVHERPDLTLEGRDRFVRFMRDERPETDTTHPLDGVFRRADAEGNPETEVAVRGRLLRADGTQLAAFVDVFAVAEGRLQSLRTYTA